MYSQLVTRRDPGCIVFLLDRSDSMKRLFAGPGPSLAEGAARILNKLLGELMFLATKNTSEGVRHYLDIGIWGYGMRPATSEEGVESAFGGNLAGQGLVPLPVVEVNPLGTREEPLPGVPGATAQVPIWVEPVHGHKTPMCAAIAEVGGHVAAWAQAHPRSFPPIVLNITDGWVTDSPFQGVDIAEWADRLTRIQTEDGAALLFNVFLSDTAAESVMFPSSGAGLPDPGSLLFTMSSPLPPLMLDSARRELPSLQAGARGLGFNADMAALTRFLRIGTDVVDYGDR